MPTRNYKPEQMVTILRQMEVQMANGKTAPQACQEAEIHTQTCYRWQRWAASTGFRSRRSTAGRVGTKGLR